MLLISFQIFPTDTHLEKKWDFGSRWYSRRGLLELPLSIDTSKYIRLWNNSHWKVLTGNWQERLLYYTRLWQRSTEHWKRRELKRWGGDLCPWSGNSRGKGKHTREICPGEWVVWVTYWMPQSWSPTQRRKTPWLTAGPRKLAGGLWGD